MTYTVYNATGEAIHEHEADDMTQDGGIVTLYLRGARIAVVMLTPGQFVSQDPEKPKK